MQESIVFPGKREYRVKVENLCFKLILNLPEKSTHPDAFNNTPHTHSHCELFVCLEGEIFINTPAGPVRLCKYDAAIVPPDIPHCRIVIEGEEQCLWSCINFGCTKRAVREGFDLYSRVTGFFRTDCVSVLRNKENLCREIYDVSESFPDEGEIFPALRIVSALSLLNSSDIEQCKEIERDCVEYSSDADIGLLYKLNHIINSCFMKDFTNSEISQMLFISERQLSRISLKHYGMTIRQAIIERRLLAAETLLSETDDTIERVSAYVGFTSKSGFYRDFYKKYGVTPSEYRKMHRNKA